MPGSLGHEEQDAKTFASWVGNPVAIFYMLFVWKAIFGYVCLMVLKQKNLISKPFFNPNMIFFTLKTYFFNKHFYLIIGINFCENQQKKQFFFYKNP